MPHRIPPFCFVVGTRPPDPALRGEKEALTEQYYESGEKLLASRTSGYSLARQLENDKRKLQLQVAVSEKAFLVCQFLYDVGVILSIGKVSADGNSVLS